MIEPDFVVGPRKNAVLRGVEDYHSPQVKCRFPNWLPTNAGTCGDAGTYPRLSCARVTCMYVSTCNSSTGSGIERVPASPRKEAYVYK